MANGVAVTFDFDGVVVDTVGALCGIYMDVLAGFGVSGSRSEFDRLNGRNLDEIAAILRQRYGLRDSGHAIRGRFEQRFSLLYEQAELVDGIASVLDVLKAHSVVVGLASAASRRSIDAVLGRFDLRRHFDFVVSGDQVKRAKPHPQIYRLAKAHCDCIEHFAIEDSTNGIQAALGAGLVAVYLDPQRESGRHGAQQAPYSIACLSELPRIVLEDKAVIVAKSGRILVKHEPGQPQTSGRQERLVDRIWAAALEQMPSLFNGEVASYCGHETLADGTLIVACRATEYRHVLAGLRDRQSGLAPPVGVSGVVMGSDNKVLLGKRSQHVAEYPGYVELVGSGGLESRHMAGDGYLEQIKAELFEEAGIDSANIAEVIPLGLIYDRAHGVFDICAKVVLDCHIESAGLISEEYSELRAVDASILTELIEREAVVPVSKAIHRAML